jgi:hypothetical protein
VDLSGAVPGSDAPLEDAVYLGRLADGRLIVVYEAMDAPEVDMQLVEREAIWAIETVSGGERLKDQYATHEAGFTDLFRRIMDRLRQEPPRG